MELAVRKGADRFVAPGAYRDLQARLRERSEELQEVPTVVLSAFDRNTRLLPFVLYDSRMFPAGAAAIASALYEAGFRSTRAVFQLWNPNFRASRAKIDGRPLQMLLVSSMQIHSRRAYDAIREAWSMGSERPLIIAGGPKAVYEPYDFWPVPGQNQPLAPDVVVTGESYVLLELLNAVVQHRGRGETMRLAFERARREGALESIPGLVYLEPGATLRAPVLVDTGLQRLVQNLDELPRATTGLTLLEAPHWSAGLHAKAVPDSEVGRHTMIASLLVTQGCKFNCPYCPIPAANQKSWRFRSPESLVNEIRTLRERFGIRYFFGADDNFFNHRETVVDILTAMARAEARGGPFSRHIWFATEATQFDTYKNRDLLPLAREAGMRAIWFGIEDLTATLINKGQKPAVTIELFRLMLERRISPMAMIMFHNGQPYYTPGSLYGLFNQIEFLRKAGAISVQVTAHSPAVGTREYETTYSTGRVLAGIGRYRIPEWMMDGNHIVVIDNEPSWKRQLKLLGGYAAFYNPFNLARALRKDRDDLRRKRIVYQLLGFMAVIWTALKTLPYVVRLMVGRLMFHKEPPSFQTTVPVRSPATAFLRFPIAASGTGRKKPEKAPATASVH
ncbi:MAG: B12-binding domain-containing radical SAM protein [Candidatus Binatia bacterium]